MMARKIAINREREPPEPERELVSVDVPDGYDVVCVFCETPMKCNMTHEEEEEYGGGWLGGGTYGKAICYGCVRTLSRVLETSDRMEKENERSVQTSKAIN